MKRFLKKTGIARRTSLICETYQETLRQIEKNKIYENIGVRWTEQEEEELVNEYTSGCSVSEIAKMHKRKIGGIKARLVRLGFAKYRKDITNIYVPPTL